MKISSAIISHVVADLDVSCLPKDLPEFIEVDLTELDVGHSIHVSALKMPPGVTVVSRGKLDPVVATAIVPRAQVETEEETAAAAEAAAAAAAVAAPVEGEAEPAVEKGAEKKEGKKEDKKDDKKK